MALRFTIWVLFLFIALISGRETLAADYSHGDSCSAAGAWHQTNTSGHMDFLICDGAAWRSAARYNSTGNNLTLDDNPAVAGAGCIQYTSASGGKLQFSNDCTTYTDLDSAGLWFSSGSDIYYSSGYVGIFRDTPHAPLTVYDDDSTPKSWDQAQHIFNGSYGSSSSYSATVGLQAVVENGVTGAGFTEAIAILGAGVGTDDTKSQYVYGVQGKVSIHDTDVGYALLASDDSSSTSGTAYGLYIDMDNTNTTRYGIYQETANDNYFAGPVGIGTNSPSVELDVVGDIHYTGTIVDVSDIRMKYDIAAFDSPLRRLTSLNGFSFKMKGDEKENVEYGVSAQDVHKVFPDLVHEVDDNGTLGVSYTGLIAPMIEAMKEQQDQIENLTAEIEALKAQINNNPEKL